MPVGTRKDLREINRGYEKDKMHALAEEFLAVAESSLRENGMDIYSEPQKFFMSNACYNELKNFFVNESYDPEDPRFKNNPEAIQEYEEDLGALFENDVEAIQESAPLGSMNAVIGITFPMHKNLLQTTIFDKGAIPKKVAVSPKFTLSMETRTLVDVNGNEIDMFLEQNRIHDAIKDSVPQKDVLMKLPENLTTDIVKTYFNGNGNLSIITHINGVVVNGFAAAGTDTYDVGSNKIVQGGGKDALADIVVPINKLEFKTSYGEFDRSIVASVRVVVPQDKDGKTTKTYEGVISGYMKKNMFMLMCNNSDIKAIQMHAVMDVSSAAFDQPYTKWSVRTDLFEIPEAPHIATNISPEEVKDINALYQVNQVTKIMSMMNLALQNYKDDDIRLQLDDSFLNLPKSQKISGAFDFVPPQNYMQDPITWRQTMFMDYLDTWVTNMLQVLNDENMTISVFGRPDLIRKITPTEYTYQTPSSIGPVELDFKKTVVTSDKRVYQFFSSQKLRNNNNLILILCPRNTQRVMYLILDYQFYVSNELRTTKGYQLPAVSAFERWKMIQYQPVQGRIQIKNPRGLREVLDNDDPIGTSAMNDYTANNNDYSSVVNGAIVHKQ